MKKFSVIIFLLIVSISLKSQPSSTNVKLMVDFNHYTVSQATHDSIFVKYIQFDLSDTATVSKISYTLSDLSTGSQIQKDYNFTGSSSVQNLTIAQNCVRIKKNVKISLGYFKYEEKNYKVNITLYDVTGNLLSSTDFNFSH